MFVILLMGLTVACSENEPFNVKVARNLGLASITSNSYKINFYENRPTGIQYSGGSHDDFEFHSDLIYKLRSFDSENNLVVTSIYHYDTAGRITGIKINPTNPPWQGDTLTNTTSYAANQINSIWNSRQGMIKKSKMTLNQQGEIIIDEVSYPDGTANSTSFTYSNGNLISCQVSNSKNSEIEFRSFTYLNQENIDYSYYKKFLFGAAWKNNSAIDFPDGNLDGPFFPPSTQCVYPQVSRHLVSTYNLGNSSASISYEFDAQDNLKKQTQEFTLADRSKRQTITTFEYKYGL